MCVEVIVCYIIVVFLDTVYINDHTVVTCNKKKQKKLLMCNCTRPNHNDVKRKV